MPHHPRASESRQRVANRHELSMVVERNDATGERRPDNCNGNLQLVVFAVGRTGRRVQ